MRRYSLPVVLLLSTMVPMHASLAQEWTESFEAGIGTAKPYHRDAPQAQLALATDGAAEGQHAIRAALPGERKLEGVNVTATGLAGGRLAAVAAKVRGRGNIWLCLISSNGWLYSSSTVPLTDEWQEVSLSKVLMARDTQLGIHFLSRDVQKGAVFEVDDIRVALAEAPEVYDAEVGPWRLEAEDFAARVADVADDSSAPGGKVLRNGRYLALEGLPFPRCSGAITVHLRVKPGAEAEDYRLYTRQGGNRQTLYGVKPETTGAWQWLHFPPVTAGEVGDRFGVDLNRDKAVAEVPPSAIDSLVISTRDDLSDEALAQAPPLFPGFPLAVVTRCAQPPVIDGASEDACWRQTVACGGFLVVGSLVPAEAATTARLCYDDENLYVLFDCEEPILDPRMQKRHEFSARIEERDGEVSRDDSCVLLIDPGGDGAPVVDFIVNALGTVSDARCPGPDLWETRDASWNSGAHAAGSVSDGKWELEMAIPLTDLSGGSPQPGDIWHACLGRIAKARGENSSWNPSNRGFHDPQTMGALVFAGDAPAIEMTAPGSLQLGGNLLHFRISPVPGRSAGVYRMMWLRGATTARHSYDFLALDDRTIGTNWRFEIAEEGQLQPLYGVLDAATLQPLCLSPLVTRAVQSSEATITFACDGPYELRLNEQVLQRGPSADGIELRAPLQRGPNVFVLKLEDGTAAVKIATPGMDEVPANWKVAPVDVPDPMLPNLDDSGWATAGKVGDHPQLGPIIGERGKPVVLRSTLLWEKTRVWPTPKPALYIARNTTQHLTFITDGLEGRKLLDWTVFLAVPPEFEILGSTGYYGTTVDYQPQFICTQLGEQTIDGRPVRVAGIVASKPIVPGRHYIMSLFNAFVRLRDDAAGEETSFVYWATANDGTVVEPRQVVPVRLLPALRGRQCKQFVWQLWGSFFSSMDDPAMREATLATAQAAGFNDIVAGNRWTSDTAPKYGMRHTMGMNFQAWSLNMKPYLEDHPDERLIGSDGEPNDSLLCASLLLGDSWPAVEAVLAERIDAVRADTLDYDYEYPPFTGPHSCYCPRCLQAFREHAGLAADVELTPETIEAEHADAWVDFMARRAAQVFARFKESIHRIAPRTEFSVYSGYQRPANPREYGVDWAYVGELQACDRIGCGYGRPAEAVSATVEAAAGIPTIFGALMHPYDTSKTEPSVPLTKARLLRRALDATGGVLVYDRLPMDGRSWLAVAETTPLVAEFEALFLEQRPRPVADLDEGAMATLSDGEVTLVCAMNGGSKPAEYAIRLPAGAGPGQEFYSGETVAAGETVNCALPPGEAAVYVLRK
jgi:hypothetical protein